jgi:hypothetical protein
VTTTSPKPGAPVVGFNHNVQYGPRVYHVQTEDSGLPHAHYITHLFVGGNIVASMKTSYAEKVSERNLAGVVRSLMEGQHKAMLKRLVSGEFNEMAERLSATHYDPGVLADGSNQASYVNTGPSAGSPDAARPPAVGKAVAPAAKPLKPAPPGAPRPSAPALKPAPQHPVWQASPPAASPSSPRTPGQPLPNVTRAPSQPTRPAAPPRMVPVQQPTSPPPRSAGAKRPAPTFFSETPVEAPHEDLPTLFAEELISEKSLDEVILAFLSADLDPPK